LTKVRRVVFWEGREECCKVVVVLRLFLLLVEEDMLWVVEVVVSGGGEDGEYRGVGGVVKECDGKNVKGLAPILAPLQEAIRER
jgi:hypothetical protein